MKSTFLKGTLFGALLVPFSTLGLISLWVEILTKPLTLVPRFVIIHSMNTGTKNGVLTMGLMLVVSAIFYGLVAMGSVWLGKKTHPSIPLVLLIIAYVVAMTLGTRESMTPPQNSEGNVGVACMTAKDCVTPMSYLTRSICPFGSSCIQGKCAVTCTMMRHTPDPQNSESFVVGCSKDNDCNCEGYAGSDMKRCICDNGSCAGVFAQ